MSQQVETEEEAIQLAEAFLKKEEVLREEHYTNWSKQNGREVTFSPRVFKLHNKTANDRDWFLTYMVENEDPGIFPVVVNKLTGEVKFRGF